MRLENIHSACLPIVCKGSPPVSKAMKPPGLSMPTAELQMSRSMAEPVSLPPSRALQGSCLVTSA